MHDFEGEDLRRIVTLEPNNKAQARLIEEIKMENKDLKKILHIIEEKYHNFKEHIFYLKKQLEKAMRIEEEIDGQLKIKSPIVRN